jgi:translation initiation factor 2B subunit (eIF-2B alpha/beta/delta family)
MSQPPPQPQHQYQAHPPSSLTVTSGNADDGSAAKDKKLKKEKSQDKGVGGASDKQHQHQQPGTPKEHKPKDGGSAGGGTGAGKERGQSKGKDDSGPSKSPATHAMNRNKSSDSQGGAHAPEQYRLKLFDQLLPKKTSVALESHLIDGDLQLHPATLKLGALYRHGTVRDDDDRIVALIQAFINIIDDYSTPSNKSLRDDLDKYIKAQVNYLVHCRQHCMGMGNLIKQLRFAISNIPADRSEMESKLTLRRMLESFLEERILYARQSIITNCMGMIKDNDVILTFGSSPLVRQILLAAAKQRSFRLIVVDTRPLRDGLATLQALSGALHCVYTPLSGAPAIMRDVTRVILGASSLLSNGCMLAPAGSAMVAAIAKSLRIPVIVAAESYKCCEKVQLDAIVFNELGSTREIAHMQPAKDEDVSASEGGVTAGTLIPTPQDVCSYRGSVDRTDNSLPFQVINLRYDLTPISNISVVATETGLIPPTSVPVLIRELKSGVEEQ